MPERVFTSSDDQARPAIANRLHPRAKLSPSPLRPHNNGKKRKRKTPHPSYAPRSLTSNASSESSKKEPPVGQRAFFHSHEAHPNSSRMPNEPHNAPVSNPSTGQQNGQNLFTQAQYQLKARARALWPQRKTLPIWSHVAAIRQGLRSKDIMLLVGETGSGKSTQVPQMLVQEPWFKAQTVQTRPKVGQSMPENVSVGGCIAITEPRRVAAISLARRVAEEMATPLGSNSPASKVGYSVRFDNSTGPATQVKYLTEGMLLQEILLDPWLRQYSVVVVDEVHERGVNVDLVLGFLRKMVVGKEGLEERGGVPLKLAVMSATAEVGKLLEFFKEKATENGLRAVDGHVNGHNQGKDASSEPEWSGISSSDDEMDRTMPIMGADPRPKVNGVIPKESESSPESKIEGEIPSNVSLCHIEGRQHPVKIHYTPFPVQDFVDAALRTIFQIHHKEPMPGDILVFLTGQEIVESVESLVNEYALGLSSDVPKILVLPLFAALPQAAQQRVFQPAPPNTRKVILATNIAETSVTVSGVRFVIDCGKAKIKHFRTRIGLESLLVKPISKSAAVQRKGRAGREAPGQCYRLYTEESYLGLQQSNTPEILRCDLSHAILTMKARGVDDVVRFPFLDEPPLEALEKALLLLLRLGALTETGGISDIGLRMAKVPLSIQLGRALIAASNPEHNCLEEAIDIISCLSVENVFLTITSDEKKEAAETTRRHLYRREGDHVTLLTTVRAYAAEHSDRKAWCDGHFVSHRAMRSVMDVRKQLRSLHHLTVNAEEQSQQISQEKATSILRAFLTGFAMNTARLFPDGSYKTLVGNQTAIHL
ncbi:MAG: hypothetical protein Q9217_004196 [Psora testacea]